ncbi:MAG: hypothetical protein GXO25_07575, partial [Euryarchaeota archaeon]|nr:hypothetical protein [Euryarchaeota archaeon]
MRWQIPAIMIFALLLTPGVLGDWNADNHDLQNTSSTREPGPAPPLKFLWNPNKMYIGGDWLTPIVHGGVAYL